MKTMRISFSILIILISVTFVRGQATSGTVAVIKTYSQNEKFYLRSIPYDDVTPSLRGKTSVYEKGNATPLYVFERGFDSIDDISNELILSNNGEIILYVIEWGANEEREGLKSITIYEKGKILKSFTESEITGCDKQKERCSLVYSNYDEVIDKEKSNWGTKNYKRAFKDGVDDKERFLSDFPVFSFDDTVYLTDSKKNVHLFDLTGGQLIGTEPFEKMFEQIRHKGRFNKTESIRFDAPSFSDFPRLKNGKDADESLATLLGMKSASIFAETDKQYKLYRFKINATISQDGSIEIEDIEFLEELPKEKIIDFFKANKFDSSSVPKVFDKWSIRDKFFYFRKQNPRIAREEKKQEILETRKELEVLLTQDTIDGVYIPSNLGECFVELDKLLSEIDKKEMRALSKRDEMISYHFGLGMWMRNNWGLWGASRLQRYFTDKGITHPDEMSSVVLYLYHDWLNGKKETWKAWEINPAASLVESEN
jgi:hypothetical protein